VACASAGGLWERVGVFLEADAPVGFAEEPSPILASMLYSDQPDTVYAQPPKGKPLSYLLLSARQMSDSFLGEMSQANFHTESFEDSSNVVEK
jgi:hypothetical protein